MVDVVVFILPESTGTCDWSVSAQTYFKAQNILGGLIVIYMGTPGLLPPLGCNAVALMLQTGHWVPSLYRSAAMA